ncbi:T9SS type A sorting domain-containing protein [Flavobacterium sp. GT3R68]|uniref:T9SS type A sorting domain-containing protein n=1 Tax=Flavobacterium sp. GT3R68 TaxID=2594437 RepID=UPI000F87E940|nr:T9SS type A sorting domain-containing protein [Flavobacterium sp. GT3R68]RTY91342.1 T9SS type A sorting domain-containing protein [Flavobacterium sp. GSN2]TRW93968.1 T9SS type A sorting domain-containing protein [Flavobacterium sp. GT3R68]
MKKLYTLLFLTIATVSFGQVTDPFLGTGSLNANGWVTHSGATPGQLTIAPGSITYPGMTTTGNKVALIAGNTEDVNLASSSTLTGVAYYSVIVNVPNTTGLHPSAAIGDYSLSMGSTAGATAGTLPSRLYFRTGTVANTFNIGILNNSGGTVSPSYLPTDYPVGTPLFVVTKYDIATNTASLWVNPALGGAETAANITNVTGTTAAPTQIASIILRQGGTAATGTGNVEYDNVRLGGTWAYVTSAVLGVQQNAIAGLNIYPNPVSNGTLYIDTNANAEKKVVVYNVLGKQVLSTATSGNSINVGNLNNGIYIVKVTEEGKTATRKLVIR